MSTPPPVKAFTLSAALPSLLLMTCVAPNWIANNPAAPVSASVEAIASSAFYGFCGHVWIGATSTEFAGDPLMILELTAT